MKYADIEKVYKKKHCLLKIRLPRIEFEIFVYILATRNNNEKVRLVL